MSRGKYLALNAERKEKSNTCLQSWCCGFPSLFVPSFLQMEGRVRLQGLSSQRPSCTCRQDTNRKREHSCSVYTNGGDSLAVRVHYSEVIKVPDFGGQRLSAGRGGVTHSSPDGDAIFWSVAEVVGFKRVPVGEDDGRVVSPLEVHLHVGVMEPYPELVDVWRGTQTDYRLRNTTKEHRNKVKNRTMTLIQNCQPFPWDSITALERFHDLKKLDSSFSCSVFQLSEKDGLTGFHYICACSGDVGRKCRKTAE